jgi:hypothetical protein
MDASMDGRTDQIERMDGRIGQTANGRTGFSFACDLSAGGHVAGISEHMWRCAVRMCAGHLPSKFTKYMLG